MTVQGKFLVYYNLGFIFVSVFVIILSFKITMKLGKVTAEIWEQLVFLDFQFQTSLKLVDAFPDLSQNYPLSL